MGQIYTDDASNLLRSKLSTLEGVQVTRDSMNDKKVQFIVQKGSVAIEVWFNADTQDFGFNMLTGGVKTYKDIDILLTNLNIYLYINTSFIPHAKLVGGAFEDACGISVVYHSFQGNNQGGFTARFTVIGDDLRVVQVTEVDKVYNAELLELSADKSMSRTTRSAKYRIDEANNVVEIPTVDGYVNKLYAKYQDADMVMITRTDYDKFTFDFEGKLTIKVMVLINEQNEYKINVLGVEIDGQGVDAQLGILDMDDVLDLTELYSNYIFLVEEKEDAEAVAEATQELESEDSEPTKSEPETSEVVEPEVSEESETSEGIESEDVEQEPEVSESESTETVKEEPVEVQEESAPEEFEEVAEEPASEVPEVENTSEEVTETEVDKAEETQEDKKVVDETTSGGISTMRDDLYLAKVVNEAGHLLAIRFVFPDAYYDISVEAAQEHKLPIQRITVKDVQSEHHGVILTELERTTRIYAKTVDDADAIKELVEEFFN